MWGSAKPIETEYAGCRFRSRLEARWAVFFDALGVHWQYEVEGFRLDGGKIWYLPDFWLPDLECWIEVKPDVMSDEESVKVLELAFETKKTVFVLTGSPNLSDQEANGGAFFVAANELGAHKIRSRPGVSLEPVGAFWSQCICGAVGLTNGRPAAPLPCGHDSTDRNTPRLFGAYCAARSWRFERGG